MSRRLLLIAVLLVAMLFLSGCAALAATLTPTTTTNMTTTAGPPTTTGMVACLHTRDLGATFAEVAAPPQVARSHDSLVVISDTNNTAPTATKTTAMKALTLKATARTTCPTAGATTPSFSDEPVVAEANSGPRALSEVEIGLLHGREWSISFRKSVSYYTVTLKHDPFANTRLILATF